MARILVIDDENNIRMMIRLALQHAGHTVEAAADGHEGVERFNERNDWDLVLLDYRMPGLDGLDVLKQIRYHDAHARVIMITAFGTIDLAVDALKAGATDFLRKPFTADILRGAVQTVLKGGAASPPPASSAAPEKAGSAVPHSAGPTFGMTTINGYRIEFKPQAGLKIGSDMGFNFAVRSPEDQSRQCTVVLSHLVTELVKAHTDREQMPGGDRFWQALCEEGLANYVWQNADFPPDGMLRIEELTGGLRRFVDTVLAPA